MKKLKIMALTLIVIMALALPAMADQVNVYQNNQLVKSVVFKIGVPEYVVNGQTPGVKMDVAPFIQNDRTFVPVRFLGNALGVTNDLITWDNSSQTATLKGANATLQMTIGQARVVSNGQAKAIDVAPVLKSDRTFLPARFVAEGLGYQVAWDDATQTVVCWPAGQPQPDVSAAVNYLNGQTQQPVQPPVPQGNTYTLNGYQIPVGTKLNIDKSPSDSNNPKEAELQFNIDLTKGDLQSQWNDATAILSQTLDSQTVSDVISYAKQKTARNQELKFKYWNSNGKSVGVISQWGDSGTEITVWSVPINK